MICQKTAQIDLLKPLSGHFQRREESIQLLEQSLKGQIILIDQYLLGEELLGTPHQNKLYSVKTDIHHQTGVLLGVTIVMSGKEMKTSRTRWTSMSTRPPK